MSLTGRRRLVAPASLVLALALAPPAALAADRSLSLSVVTDSVGSTAANPSRGVAGFGASLDLPLGKAAGTSFGVLYSKNRLSTTAGMPFDGSAAAVLSVRAGLSVTPDPHLTFSAAVSYSPSATSQVAVPLSEVASGALSLTGALVSVEGASRSAQGTLSLSSTGDSAFQHQLDLNVGFGRIHNTEQVLQFSNAAGPVDAVTVHATCTSKSKSAKKTSECTRLEPLLPAAAQTADIDQTSFGATYTVTVSEATSIALSATHYAYPNTDPTSVGFFPVATAGRTSVVTTGHGRNQIRSTVTTPGVLLREGTSLAAPAYELEGELGRDLGSAHAGVSLGYGRHYHLPSSEKWAGAHVTFGADKPWQLTAAGDLAWGDDADGMSVSDTRFQLALTHRF